MTISQKLRKFFAKKPCKHRFYESEVKASAYDQAVHKKLTLVRCVRCNLMVDLR